MIFAPYISLSYYIIYQKEYQDKLFFLCPLLALLLPPAMLESRPVTGRPPQGANR